MANTTKDWYALRVFSSAEKRVKEYIENEIERLNLSSSVSKILIPTEKIFQVKNGKKVNSEKLLYPGYLFIEAAMTKEVYSAIKSVNGVVDIMGTKDKAIPLRPAEIRQILQQVDESIEKDEENMTPFIKGEKVKVTDGPFKDFNAVVEEVLDDKKKLKVSVMIFGRKTIVELNFVQIVKV